MLFTFVTRLKTLSYQRKNSLALCIALSLTPQLSVAQDSQYTGLILAARAGDTGPALSFFPQQAERRALSADEVADWLQIAGWANDDRLVVSTWQRYHPVMTLPVRAQLAAARALRNLRQWQPALTVWQSALARDPDNDALQSGYIMTLADAGRTTEAVNLAQARVQRQSTAQHWLDLSYSQRAAGREWDALQSASLAESRFPGMLNVQRDYVSALSLNRVSGAALRVSPRAQPDAAEQRRLEADALAEQVRVAFASSRSEAERFDVADRALAGYERLLTAWQQQPGTQDDIRRARIDRLGALVARRQMQTAIDEYRQLSAAGEVPAYARRWVAGAFLYQQQPEEAVALYRSVQREGQPGVLTRREQDNLFYALSESEQAADARQQAAEYAAITPYWLRVYGSPVPIPNDSWLSAQQLQVQSAALADDLPEAQRRAEELAGTAPANQALQTDLAGVLLMRGWPRQAEALLKRAESLEPRNQTLETLQGHTALELQEWYQADLLADDVMQRQPESRSAQRLDRLRKVHRYYELRINGEHGIDSDSPVSGSNDVALDALLYSPPVDENWRLFTGLGFADSQYSEGKALNRSLRGGLEYRGRDNWAEMELNGQRYGSGTKTGLRVSGWHDFSDQWRVGGSAEHLMRNAPLRALRDGVTADGGTLFARWRQSERREWQASLSPSWFSDGNRRLEWSLDGKERLASGARNSLDFTPGISGSSNSKTGGAYYSPSRDLSVVPGLTLDTLLYRHYQTEWRQQIAVGAGRYWQQGQKAGAVTSVSYGQRVRWNDVLDTGVTLSWDKRPYDGVREQNLSVSLDMNYRF